MSQLLVRKFENVKSGSVRWFENGRGIVDLDDHTEVRINGDFGRRVSFNKEEKAFVFSTGKIDMPVGNWANRRRNRVVAVRNIDKPYLAIAWAYEDEYLAAKAEADKLLANRSLVGNVGEVRMMQLHTFRGERMRREPRTLWGPGSLATLVTDIERGRVQFIRSEQHGENDTVTAWIEKRVAGDWVEIDISDEEITSLAKSLEDGHSIDPIVDRLTTAGVPEKSGAKMVTLAPQSKVDRRRYIEPIGTMPVDKEFHGLSEMMARSA